MGGEREKKREREREGRDRQKDRYTEGEGERGGEREREKLGGIVQSTRLTKGYSKRVGNLETVLENVAESGDWFIALGKAHMRLIQSLEIFHSVAMETKLILV